MTGIKTNQSGVILIITMIVMTILLSIAMGFAAFILSDLRQAREIDDAILAYYTADSGLERTLYMFRQGGVRMISELSEGDRSGDLNGDGKYTWNINESTDFEPVFFRQRLFSGQGAKLYFLNRNDQSNTNIAKSIKINWFKGGNGNPKLQVIFTQLTPDTRELTPGENDMAVVYYTDINRIEQIDTPGNNGAPLCIDFKDRNIADGIVPPRNYVVELRALGNDDDYIDNLSVTAQTSESAGAATCGDEAYDATYNKEAITNVTIKSIGAYGVARQEVYAQIPPVDPISGILGFVLFSEEDVAKGY